MAGESSNVKNRIQTSPAHSTSTEETFKKNQKNQDSQRIESSAGLAGQQVRREPEDEHVPNQANTRLGTRGRIKQSGRARNKHGRFRRPPRSMGRRPIISALKAYLDYRKPYWGESTYVERSRKLKRIAAIISDLSENWVMSSNNPCKINERDIAALLGVLKIGRASCRERV